MTYHQKFFQNRLLSIKLIYQAYEEEKERILLASKLDHDRIEKEFAATCYSDHSQVDQHLCTRQMSKHSKVR